MTMAASRDTTLSKMARMVAFWIFGNPSEAINPEAIASANELTIGYVRKLLAELAGKGYLVKPQKYKAEKGRIAYTPYTIPPQANTTVTVSQPSRSETPYGENNRHGQETSTVENADGDKHEQPEISTVEYVRAPGDAATRVKDMSLKAKDKGKRKKIKDKKISPNGESVLPPTVNSPDPVNHREMHTAVCDAFKLKPGGFVGRLVQQLIGTAPDGKRREYAMTPPMTAVEVVAFGQWYREVFGSTTKVPTTAETLHERVMQFRDDTARHAKKLALAEQRLARLTQPEAKADIPPLQPPVRAQRDALREREKPVDMSTTPPVREDEVEGLVKLGLMTADEFPRPTMKTINDRLAQRMGSNHNAARTE